MAVETTSSRPSSSKGGEITQEQLYSGRSRAGDFGEALRKAIDAARAHLNTNYFTWHLHQVSGSVGGVVGARDVTVSILAGGPGSMVDPDQTSTCGDWQAWHDRMPGKAPTLYVIGVCTFPAPGYSVELRPTVPQGINPAIYMLDKVVTEPTTPVPPVLTEVPVRYAEETSVAYTQVQILPDGDLMDVKEVS